MYTLWLWSKGHPTKSGYDYSALEDCFEDFKHYLNRTEVIGEITDEELNTIVNKRNLRKECKRYLERKVI